MLEDQGTANPQKYNAISDKPSSYFSLHYGCATISTLIATFLKKIVSDLCKHTSDTNQKMIATRRRSEFLNLHALVPFQ